MDFEVKRINDGAPPRVNLDTLPTDIISEIISYLDLEDVLLLTIVNRYFYTLLPIYNSLWTHFLENDLGLSCPDDTVGIYHLVAQEFPFHRCVECKTISPLGIPLHGVFQLRLCKGIPSGEMVLHSTQRWKGN